MTIGSSLKHKRTQIDWTDNTIPEGSLVSKRIGRIWRCPIDCDLNTSPVTDDSFLGGYYLDPTPRTSRRRELLKLRLEVSV